MTTVRGAIVLGALSAALLAGGEVRAADNHYALVGISNPTNLTIHYEFRWGEHGEFCEAAQSGDFIHVPPWLPHMEANPSGNSRCVWVVVRSTAEPIVINLPSDFWGPEQQTG